MAIQDETLLNLLLAYSAFHRARLLRYPEPSTRIALWVKNIFPNLRLALNDPDKILSNTHLATAIMLASLDIISPNAFECLVPWQQHLATARQMIASRGGIRSIRQKDSIPYFLSRWFIYLDVIGSLSGGKNGLPSADNSCASEDTPYDSLENDYQIECLLGFTTRCVSILSKIAELARQCDKARLASNHNNVHSSSINEKTNDQWHPSIEIINKANKLIQDLETAMKHTHKSCPHLNADNSSKGIEERDETLATNEAFHWAGLIHIHRRILLKKSSDSSVQLPVAKIMELLTRIKKGGAAEGCLLFPIFTAGCEIGIEKDGDEGLSEQERRWRSELLERMKWLESGGMAQMGRARRLMERVWVEGCGRSWVEIVEGDFFG